MKPKIVAIIPIRKNSRRIKNKNFINFFKGNSLLEIKIKQLKKINKIDKIIVSSDSLLARKIAYKYNVSIEKLLKINNLKNPDLLERGQKINIRN